MSTAPIVNNRQLYIDGQWCDASTGKKLGVVNPATEETFAEVSFGNRADCAKAVAAASAAMPAWMKLTPYDRAKVLKKTADLMRERADTLARTMTTEQGKPLPEAKAEVLHSADTFEWFAEEGKRAYGQVIPPANAAKRHLTIKHPVGVVGAIGPWNFPITLQSRKIAPALAAGCTIVCKPASQTPLSLIGVFECLIDAGLPKAVAAASAAMPAWMKLTPYDRAKVLKKTADLMRERADTLARTMTTEQGKPLPEAKAEVLHSADTFEWFAEEGKRAYGQVIPPANAAKRHLTIKHPVGVVGAIGPWNFPITLQSRKIAPALAAGCTIVCKPASQTPLSLIGVFECLIDAGLPKGVANLVIGSAGEISDEFMENPAVRKISFTGSTDVGKRLMKQAADQVKRLSLELGGHAPFIVFPDADPEVVAKAAVLGKFRNNGQVCISPSRFFVHKDVQKKFVEVAVEEAKKLKMGNGLEEGVVVGPMFEKKAMEGTQALIDDAKGKGAAILTGGCRSKKFEKGYFFEPTILSGLSADARILTDEPFAPVMPVLDFSKIDDVLAAANNTKYGLAAYVFTNDISVAWRMAEGLEAGIIGLNDPVPATPQCPFGGMKESGLGRELAHEGLEAYLETKYVSMMLRS